MDKANDASEVIFSSDNKNDVLFIQGLLEKNGVKTYVANFSDNDVFGLEHSNDIFDIRIVRADHETATKIIENDAAYQQEVSELPPETETTEKSISTYYKSVFAGFDQKPYGFKMTWNWGACLFGPIWYLYNSMFLRGGIIAIIAAAIALVNFPYHGLCIAALWIYCGLFGNYQLYLKYNRANPAAP